MIVSIVLATVYGAFQLWVLATPTRTIRLRTVVLGILSGLVVTLPVAVLLEWGWTRVALRFVDSRKYEFVQFAGWTVDPFIEEIIRLIPLILIVVTVRACRRQWALTDLVVFGAAVGGGYRVGEHLARFPSTPSDIIGSLFDTGGWVFGGIGSVIYAPLPQTWLFQWCPDGIQTLAGLVSAPGENHNFLLIWGTLAGLAVGLAVMVRHRIAGAWVKRVPWRVVAFALVLLACLSHAAVNADYSNADWPFGLLAIPRWLTNFLGWWSILALGTAMALDVTTLRAAKSHEPQVLLAPQNEAAALLQLARQDLPVSAFAVAEFLRVRRMYLYERSGPAETADTADERGELAETVSVMTARLIWASTGGELWGAVRDERRTARRRRFAALFRFPTVVLVAAGLLCALLPLLYLVIGGTRSMGSVQDWFVHNPWMAWVPAVLSVGLAASTLALLGWWWHKIPTTVAEFRTTAALAMMNQTVGLVMGLFLLNGYRTGKPLQLPVIDNFLHGLDAFGALLLVVGLVVLTLAITATGGTVLVGGAALMTVDSALVAGGAMSATGLALMAADPPSLPKFDVDDIKPEGLPPPPLGPAIGIAAKLIHDAVSGDQNWAPPPDQGWSYDTDTQYRDQAGDIRWKDTGERVSDNPNRDDAVADSGKSSAPPGFANGHTFLDFGDAFQAGLHDAGIDDASLYLQGSAVTNRRHDSGEPFGPDSDYDVLIVSDQLAERARGAGIEFRNNGVSRPIDDVDLAAPLGLDGLQNQLGERFGHNLNFRIVSTRDAPHAQGGIYVPSRNG